MVGLVFGLPSLLLLSISPVSLFSSLLFSSPMFYGSWFHLSSTRRRRRVLLCIEAVTVMRVLPLGSPGRVRSVLRLSLVSVFALSASRAAVGVSPLLGAGSVIGCSARRGNLLSVLAIASKQGRCERVRERRSRCRRHSLSCSHRRCVLRVTARFRAAGITCLARKRERGESERGEREILAMEVSLSPLSGVGGCHVATWLCVELAVRLW